MKIEQVIQDSPDKIQVAQQVPVKTETLVDTIRPHKGHTLFEIDCSTGEINAAKYEQIDGVFSGVGVRKKVLIKENCLYISCLNKKTALKKYTAWITDRLMSNIKNAIDEKEKTNP